jgi:ABC-type transporter Mla subunit MlaD
MSAPANRWKLGLFVLAGFGAAGTGFTWLGVHELKRATHEAWAYFDEALTGLEEGSPVKFRGVTIGRVDRIRVGPDKKHLAVQAALYDDYLVDIGLDPSSIDGDCPLPPNLRAQVVISWVTGTAFVQVDFFPDPSSGPQMLPFPTGSNTLRTVPSTAKSFEGALRELLVDLPQTLTAARDLLQRLDRDLEGANVPQLAARATNVLDGIERELAALREQGTIAAGTRAFTEVGDLAASLRDERGPLRSALADLAGLSADLRAELAEADLSGTTAGLRTAAADVGSAGASVRELGRDLRGEVRSLRGALAAIERLADLLERDPAALLHGRGAPQTPLEAKGR